MTSTLAQGVGRSPGEPVRPLSVLALSPALLVLLLAGLLLRLTIAYVLFPASGFESDVASYAAWAATMAEYGPAGFYANAGFADYPPAYLYVLWLAGLLAGPAGDASALIKLPPMLLDVAVAYVVYRLVRGWTWPGSRSEALALGASAAYLFNPVAFYDSALWGQTDAAGALVLLLGLAALIRGNAEGAAALAATAALVKPQFGVVLIPIVAAVLLKRHLLQVGSGPRHRPWAPARLAAWLAREQGPARLLTAFAAAWLAFFLIALPFGMGPLEYLERMFGTAGGYGYLSVNAFNLWALVAPPDGTSLAQALSWNEDTLPLVGPVPGVAIGAALLVAGFLWGIWRAAVRDDRWTLIVATTFLAIAFFILPTRVHERYLFPAIALMPLLAAVSGRWALALLLLTVGAFINLHAILTLPLYGSENVESLPLGEWFRTTPLIVTSALLQTGVGVWALWQLRPSLASSPDGFDRMAGRAGAVLVTATGGSPPPPPVTAPTDPDPLPMRDFGAAPPSTLDRLVARFSWGSLRRDRSATLTREPGGRFDRWDLLVVMLVVVATLLLRGYKLDQPVRMYFDEVYHARTATEFLQHWEYGEPHDIYEFTHPHLAKYAMAWGIRLAGGNEVVEEQDLSVMLDGDAVLDRSLADAVMEERWSPSTDAGARKGDRLWLATEGEIVAYDLERAAPEGTWPLAATALAVDQDAHLVYATDASGRIHRFSTELLDLWRTQDPAGTELVPEPFSDGPGAPVERLLVTDAALVAATLGSLWSFDLETGALLGQRLAVDTTDMVELPWAERLVVDTGALDDRAAAAARIAQAGASDAERIVDLLEPGGRALTERWDDDRDDVLARLSRDGPVVLEAWLPSERADDLLELIDAGSLSGAGLESGPLLAVSDAAGITVLDARTLDPLEEIATAVPVTALMLDDGGDEPTLYAAAGAAIEHVRITEDGPGIPESMWMPGTVEELVWNAAAGLFHAYGESPDGDPTVYVVEPRGRSVFADVPLGFEARRLVADTQPDYPHDDRTELFALAADGRVATIDIGSNAFGWRLPGILFGALTAALVYLLARVLFARRNVAVIAAVLVVAEGMLFANARIAMNDVYVTAFIVLAALLFAPLYLARRRPWTVLLLLLGVGVALGLGLASKWVALYAIGGLGLLVLFRSALGRTIALVVMMAMTAVLGAMAIRAAPVDDPMRNWIFLLLMLVLTGLLAAAIVRRPLPFTRAEVLLAVAMPVLAGIVLAVLGELMYSGLAFAAAATVAVVTMVATSTGHGPWVPGARLPDPATSVWLRPGPVPGPSWPYGLSVFSTLPWLITLAALTVLPIVVYIVGYAPWVSLGNAWGLPLLGDLPFLPSSTEGGRTLAALTESMYQYHDNLRAEHAASSPWWAWPLDLKPVWFFSERYAGDSQGLIYDTGNLVVFWMGLAGMGFAAWSAWRRRSLSLTIVVIMWAALWLPWARVDRAAFQYHVYASLPFLIIGLAYFLAELWHGPNARVWFLGRAAAALAIVGIPLLWLARTPLCILSGTALAHPDGVACASEVTRTAQLSEGGVTALLVLGVGAGLAAFLAWRGSRASSSRGAYTLALLVVGLLTLGAVIAALLLLDTSSTAGLNVSSDVLALAGLVVLALPAWLVLRARDPRRFVLGVLAAALLWLLIWYPNISALPLPGDLAHLYQGLLPTWNWDFQFAVNTDPAVDSGVLDQGTLIVAAVTVLFVAAVGYAAWRWNRPSPA